MNNNQAIAFYKENFKQILSKEFILVIIASIPSAIFADYLNIPLAWFLGPMIITSVISLSGIRVIMPRFVLSSILIILGLYIGNYIDKNLFEQIHEWLWTSLIMLIYIITSILLVSRYLQKFSLYDKKTSIFSAAPGALGPLLILAEDEKSDLSQVATSHLIRLIIIITIFPFLVNSLSNIEEVEVVTIINNDQSLVQLGILIIFSLFLIFIFNKLKIPAALLSGTLVASGFLQIIGVASFKLPPNIIDYCLLILGSSVGCRFADKTFAEIAKNCGADVPFLRPAKISMDNTRDYPFMRHALDYLDSVGDVYDIYILLRPTSPLRPEGLIEKSIDILNKNPSATSVRAVARAKEHPYRVLGINEDGSISSMISDIEEPYNFPRQELPEAYFMTGDIEAARRETLLSGSVSGNKIYPLIINPEDKIDIDSIEDFKIAEKRLKY